MKDFEFNLKTYTMSQVKHIPFSTPKWSLKSQLEFLVKKQWYLSDPSVLNLVSTDPWCFCACNMYWCLCARSCILSKSELIALHRSAKPSGWSTRRVSACLSRVLPGWASYPPALTGSSRTYKLFSVQTLDCWTFLRIKVCLWCWGKAIKRSRRVYILNPLGESISFSLIIRPPIKKKKQT